MRLNFFRAGDSIIIIVSTQHNHDENENEFAEANSKIVISYLFCNMITNVFDIIASIWWISLPHFIFSWSKIVKKKKRDSRTSKFRSYSSSVYSLLLCGVQVLPAQGKDMESDWFTKTERNRVRQSEIIDETDREESERKRERDRETDREERERQASEWQRKER